MILGYDFVSDLLYTLKPKKSENFFQKPRFFQPGRFQQLKRHVANQNF